MHDALHLEEFPDIESVARRGAQAIGETARRASERRPFLLALSGGRTPAPMFRRLADMEIPWEFVHIFQVDERFALPGSEDRNFTHLQRDLLNSIRIPVDHIHPMPVDEDDPAAAAAEYAALLGRLVGTPPVFDLVHLGLGPDGHTASLVPGDPVLDAESTVAITGEYAGHRRMTITYPVLDRARRILWVVTGAEKADALARLRRGDRTIPAGRVASGNALVLADAAAIGRSEEPGSR